MAMKGIWYCCITIMFAPLSGALATTLYLHNSYLKGSFPTDFDPTGPYHVASQQL